MLEERRPKQEGTGTVLQWAGARLQNRGLGPGKDLESDPHGSSPDGASGRGSSSAPAASPVGPTAALGPEWAGVGFPQGWRSRPPCDSAQNSELGPGLLATPTGWTKATGGRTEGRAAGAARRSQGSQADTLTHESLPSSLWDQLMFPIKMEI